MNSIFESNETFDDAYMDFKFISSYGKLKAVLSNTISGKINKTPIIWQMRGNKVLDTVTDCIDDVLDIDYYIVNKNTTASDLMEYDESHLYNNENDANNDNTLGFIIFDNFSSANFSLKKLILDIIRNKKLYVAKNWKIIILANIEKGNYIWEPDFAKIFNNYEYISRPKDEDYLSSDELNDNKKEDRKEDISEGFYDDSEFMDIDEAKEKIYTILYKAASKNEISPNEYIYIDEDGIVVDDESGFDPDVLYYARKADNFIDFDALAKGHVIIYTDALYKFIEETMNATK